jgi:hypothetical protein
MPLKYSPGLVTAVVQDSFLTGFLKTGHKVVHSVRFSDQIIVPTKGTVLHAYEY